MEFKLNKIDTDLRRKLMEQTKDGKVHGPSKKEITIKAYSEDEETAKDRRSFKETLKRSKQQGGKDHKIVVEGVMVDNLQVEGEKEISNNSSLGVFVDTKK